MEAVHHLLLADAEGELDWSLSSCQRYRLSVPSRDGVTYHGICCRRRRFPLAGLESACRTALTDHVPDPQAHLWFELSLV